MRSVQRIQQTGAPPILAIRELRAAFSGPNRRESTSEETSCGIHMRTDMIVMEICDVLEGLARLLDSLGEFETF